MFITGLWIFLFFPTIQAHELEGSGLYDLVMQAEKAVNYGDYDTAIELYGKMADMYENTVGPAHPHTIILFQKLYSVYFSAKKYDEALALAWKIYKIKEKIHGKEHEGTVQALRILANTYFVLKKYEKAEELLKRAYRLTKGQLGQNHKYTIQLLFLLAQVYRQSTDPEKLNLALRYYRKVYDVRSKDPELGEKHQDTLEALHNIGNVLAIQKHFEESTQIFKQIFEIRKTTLGDNHPFTQEVKKALMYTLTQDGKTGQANEILRREESDKDKVDESLFILVEAKTAALEKQGKYSKAHKILTEFIHLEILKPEVPTKIYTFLDKVVSYSRNQGDLEQMIKWINVFNDLISLKKVPLTSWNDQENSVLLYLNAVESITYIPSGKNEEEKIDNCYLAAVEVVTKHLKSVKIINKFFMLSQRLADFKAKIGIPEEAAKLYKKTWSYQVEKIDESKIDHVKETKGSSFMKLSETVNFVQHKKEFQQGDLDSESKIGDTREKNEL